VQLSPLLDHLWNQGFSVWSLRFSQHAQSPEIMHQSISKAIATHKNPFIVAQGFSGTIFVEKAEQYQDSIAGLALLGSPIVLSCPSALLNALNNNDWTVFDNPPIQNANRSFHEALKERCSRKLDTTYITPFQNVWAATTNANPLAPPESVRLHLQKNHRFLRSGPLSLHGIEPNHIDLFAHKHTLKDLSYWIWEKENKEKGK
jgi:hypothetical protein